MSEAQRRGIRQSKGVGRRILSQQTVSDRVGLQGPRRQRRRRRRRRTSTGLRSRKRTREEKMASGAPTLPRQRSRAFRGLVRDGRPKDAVWL